jgi:pimeloyl-ACP methyl ester carboxylesterase
MSSPADKPPVLLIHGSLSSGRMWAPYLPAISTSRGTIVPDLLGYGALTPWADEPAPSLREEGERLLTGVAGAIDIVAHSYGAAVALRILADGPHQVRSLVLIEPCCFSFLKELGPRAVPVRKEIGALQEDLERLLASGDIGGATARFIDYWSGRGAFRAMPEHRRAALIARVRKVPYDFRAAVDDRMRFDLLRRVQVPTLVVTGDRGPDAPRILGGAIAKAMPRGSGFPIAGAGHMLPVTHSLPLLQVLCRWFNLDEPVPAARAA